MRVPSVFVCAWLFVTALCPATVPASTIGPGRWVRGKEAAAMLAAHEHARASAARLPAAPLAVRAASGVLGSPAWTSGGIPMVTTSSLQFQPSAISDFAGGVIAAWIDFRRFHYDIYAARLDGNGNPLWPAAGVQVAANDSMLFQPVVMPDGANGAFILYGQFTLAGEYSNILVQHLTSAGAIASGWPANGVGIAPGGAMGFGAVPTNDGFLLMGWTDLAGQLRALRLNGDGGVAGGWPAAGLAIGRPQNEGTIRPAPDGAGGAYLCWAESDSLMLTRVADVGSVASGWTAAGTAVNTVTTASGVGLSATLLTSGDVMVFWPDFRNLTDYDIYAMRYTAGGSPAGGWPATGALVLGGPTFQEEPDAVPDGAGGAVVTCQVGSDSVVAQRVTATGGISSGWPADGVTLCRHVTKSPASSISDGASGAIFAWSATNGVDDDIFAQRAAAGGTLAPGWPDGGRTVCAATGDQINPSVVTDGSNGTIAVWEDDRGVYSAIYAARVLADGTVGALTALASARAEPGLVTLSWWSPAGTALDATLERAEVGAGFVEIARLRLASGLVTYEDRDVVAGRTYQYRIAVAESGRTSYLGAVTLHVPEGYRLALAGLLPNPVVGATRLAYSLPTAEPAHIEVLDASGRRVIARDLDSAPGEHVVAFDRAALRPGIYVLKLSQGSRAVMARAAIVR